MTYEMVVSITLVVRRTVEERTFMSVAASLVKGMRLDTFCEPVRTSSTLPVGGALAPAETLDATISAETSTGMKQRSSAMRWKRCMAIAMDGAVGGAKLREQLQHTGPRYGLCGNGAGSRKVGGGSAMGGRDQLEPSIAKQGGRYVARLHGRI